MAKLMSARELVQRKYDLMADTSGIPRRLKAKPRKWNIGRTMADVRTKTANRPVEAAMRRKLGGISAGPAKAKAASGGAGAFEKFTGIKPGTAASGIMGLIVVNSLINKLMGHSLGSKDLGIQERHVEAISGMGDDPYYAAALPELEAERKQAQMALFRTVMGGRGAPIPVPGERRIGYSM